MIEQLTDEQWRSLSDCCTNGPTCDRCAGPIAARIISRLAADRAALVAQHELAIGEWRAAAEGQRDRANELEAQVAELARERDEARADVRAAHQAHADAVNAKQAEVTRLTEALAAAEADDRLSRTQRDVLQAEVERLKEALAASERAHAETCSTLPTLLAAQPATEWSYATAAQSTEELMQRVRATAPTRTEAEQRVLDAMGQLDIEMLKAVRDGWSAAPPVLHPPCLAELARREASRG